MMLLLAMFSTATVETILLYALKYRGWKILEYFFLLNLLSNLIVNIVYSNTWNMLPHYILVPLLEISVVLFEAFLLGLKVGYDKKLWGAVFLTNLGSFLLGVLLFGL